MPVSLYAGQEIDKEDKKKLNTRYLELETETDFFVWSLGSGVNRTKHSDWTSACKLHCITDKIHQHYKQSSVTVLI